MMDPELKKKIVNTISRYEQKCDKLQLEIDSLKSTITHLVDLPAGIHVELDAELDKLKEDISGKVDPLSLQQRITMLAGLMTSLHQQKSNNQEYVITQLGQSADFLQRLVRTPADTRELVKMRQTLKKEKDGEALFKQFNSLLQQVVNSTMKHLDLDEAETKQNKKDGVLVTPQVNESLHQLLNHLAIPSELNDKLGKVKFELEKRLSPSDLTKIIDELTDLVIEAFNIEQNRFRGFLQHITLQLNQFNSYLNTSVNSHQQMHSDSEALESGIQSNIKQIKHHLDNATTVLEMAEKVNLELINIESKVRAYREDQQKKLAEYDKSIEELRADLEQSREDAEEIRNLLSLQKQKINHDTLTGIPNRESYNEHIGEAYQRWQRGMSNLCLAIADIDHFKQINDTYGHLAGDKVLKKIALIFKSSIRAVDFVARYGGEEFVFIFEQTPAEDAAMILEKLRMAIEECQFCYRDDRVDVTVSFGYTEMSELDDLESFFARADLALYESKNGGRNRVTKI